jgi:hypothetical protein
VPEADRVTERIKHLAQSFPADLARGQLRLPARVFGRSRAGRQNSRMEPPRPDGQPAAAGLTTPAMAKAAAIRAGQAHPLTWKTIVKRAIVLAAAGLAIYLVLPSLTEVLASWPRLSELNPVWFTVAVAAELVSFTCNFGLQRLALRTRGWFAVVTAGLSGNAVTNSLPGGDAAGAAVQFSMLSTAGFDTDTAVGGLTAFSLLGIGGLLALPVLALPAMLAGAPVSAGLAHTAILGIAGFVLFAIFGAVILHTDWPLAAAGRAAQGTWNLITRGHRPPGNRSRPAAADPAGRDQDRAREEMVAGPAAHHRTPRV